jgi:hypothetical protein
LTVTFANSSCRVPISNLIAPQESSPPCCSNPSNSAFANAFLYHHLETQIPGYFFHGPFIPNLILFVSRWCQSGRFPIPLDGGIYCITWPVWHIRGWRRSFVHGRQVVCGENSRKNFLIPGTRSRKD